MSMTPEEAIKRNEIVAEQLRNVPADSHIRYTRVWGHELPTIRIDAKSAREMFSGCEAVRREWLKTSDVATIDHNGVTWEWEIPPIVKPEPEPRADIYYVPPVAEAACDVEAE